MSGTFQGVDLKVEPEDRGRFFGRTVNWQHGDFEVITSESLAHTTVQTKDYVSHIDDNYLFLYHQIASEEGCQFKRSDVDDVHLKPGEMYIYHPVLACDLVPVDNTDSKTVVFRFHKRHLETVVGTLPAYLPARLVSGAQGAQRLLTSYVQSLTQELPFLTGTAADAAINAFYGLAAAAYGAIDPDHEIVSDATNAGRLNMAKKMLAVHCINPAMSPALIAHNMGVSERTLHRTFEMAGESFTAALRDARLERCARALRDPAMRAELISTIAFGSGFDSLATFNRQFANAFGMTPGDWRKAGL